MCKNSQQAFAILGQLARGPQGGAEQALVSGNSAFDLPAIVVHTFVKASLHLSPVFCGGPPAASASGVQRDYRGTDTKLLTAEAVIMLTIVGSVGKEPIKWKVPCRQDHRFPELGRVVGGPPSRNDRGNQMSLAVTDDGHLRPATATELLVALAVNVIGTGVPVLQSGGVNDPLCTLFYQAEVAGTLENRSEQALKSPFFSRRFSA